MADFQVNLPLFQTVGICSITHDFQTAMLAEICHIQTFIMKSSFFLSLAPGFPLQSWISLLIYCQRWSFLNYLEPVNFRCRCYSSNEKGKCYAPMQLHVTHVLYQKSSPGERNILRGMRQLLRRGPSWKPIAVDTQLFIWRCCGFLSWRRGHHCFALLGWNGLEWAGRVVAELSSRNNGPHLSA